MRERAQTMRRPARGLLTPERVGRGAGVAVLFNGQARQVTPRVVERFARALPDALVLVSRDEPEAKAHAQAIARARPRVVLSGGGDGAAMMLLNLLREEGLRPLPPLGVLRLGTGNAWAGALGAPPQFALHELLPRVPWPLPTQRFQLLEVEGRLTHFAGVGWDARILNDYRAALGAQRTPWARRLHKGLCGYLLSSVTRTVPRELACLRDRPRGSLFTGEGAFRLDARGRPLRVRPGLLYEGHISICSAATTPEFGFGLRAFPFATVMPGYLNVRIYDRDVLAALRDVPRLWRGAWPEGGMHDYFVRGMRARFDRPLPFQIAGDAAGERREIEISISREHVDAVDWRAVRDRVAFGSGAA